MDPRTSSGRRFVQQAPWKAAVLRRGYCVGDVEGERRDRGQVLHAYRRGDKAAWTNLMDPELETDPVAAWPEPGPFIGPDAAWDFYKQFEEMWAAREPYELTELIGAGNKVFICQEASMRGQASAAEVGFKLWAVSTLGNGRVIRTQWFSENVARPSKPPDCGSRRCRRRTWRSCGGPTRL